MTEHNRPQTVTIHLTATDETGKPLAGIHRQVSIKEMRQLDYPVLVEATAEAAAELEGIISTYYGMQPKP